MRVSMFFSRNYPGEYFTISINVKQREQRNDKKDFAIKQLEGKISIGFGISRVCELVL